MLIPRRLRLPVAGTAAVALAVLIVLGAHYADQRAPGAFDRAVDDWFTAHVDYRTALWFADLGNGPVIAIAVAVLLAACVWARQPRCAVLAVAGPVLAAVLTEYVFKPLVHRTKDGYLAYPSGHTSGAWTVALVIVLLALGPMRPALRRAASWVPGAVVAAAGLLALACALGLIASDYHYASDVIGGACVAITAVLTLALVLDAAPQPAMISGVSARFRTFGRDHRGGSWEHRCR